MKPNVNRKWRKKSPAKHKGTGEKRIEGKLKKQLEKEIVESKHE